MHASIREATDFREATDLKTALLTLLWKRARSLADSGGDYIIENNNYKVEQLNPLAGYQPYAPAERTVVPLHGRARGQGVRQGHLPGWLVFPTPVGGTTIGLGID